VIRELYLGTISDATHTLVIIRIRRILFLTLQVSDEISTKVG